MPYQPKNKEGKKSPNWHISWDELGPNGERIPFRIGTYQKSKQVANLAENKKRLAYQEARIAWNEGKRVSNQVISQTVFENKIEMPELIKTSGMGLLDFALLALQKKGPTRKGGWTDKELDVFFNVQFHNGDKKARLAIEKAQEKLKEAAGTPKFKSTYLKTFLINLNACIKFFGREKDPCSITPDDVSDFVKEMQKSGISESSINGRLDALSNSYRFGLADKQFINLPVKNPVYSNLHKQKVPESKVNYWNLDVRKLFITACETLQKVKVNARTLGKMLIVFCACGARVKELLAVRCSHVLMDEKTIYLVDVKGGKNRSRYVPIHDEEALKVCKEEMKGKDRNDFLFQWIGTRNLGNGGKINYRKLHDLFKQVCKLANIQSAGFHDWRKCAANDWAAGLHEDPIDDIEEIRERLGQIDSETTKIYLDRTLVKQLKVWIKAEKMKEWKQDSNKNAA